MMKPAKGFTLIEVLVVIAIIILMVGTLVPALAKARERANEISCLSNLKNISYGLEMFFKEHDEYPKDSLATALAPYVGNPSCFYCPSSGHSYEKFYVFRDKKVSTDKYIIGCPYHSNESRGVSAFRYGVIQIGRLGIVTWNKTEARINVGVEVNGGVLNFEDGSRIILNGNSSGYVLACLRMDNGQLYTIVRILKRHPVCAINVDVKRGSKFEIITPAAIAGVQGTKFKLYAQDVSGEDKQRTKVVMTEGTVEMRGRNGQVYTLGPGDEREIEEDDADCPDDPEE